MCIWAVFGYSAAPHPFFFFFFSQHLLISQVIFIFAWKEMIKVIPGSAVTNQMIPSWTLTWRSEANHNLSSYLSSDTPTGISVSER